AKPQALRSAEHRRTVSPPEDKRLRIAPAPAPRALHLALAPAPSARTPSESAAGPRSPATRTIPTATGSNRNSRPAAKPGSLEVTSTTPAGCLSPGPPGEVP